MFEHLPVHVLSVMDEGTSMSKLDNSKQQNNSHPTHNNPQMQRLDLDLQGSYTVPRITTLKLQKSHIWSVDSNILDYRGFYVFRKSGNSSYSNYKEVKTARFG